MSAASAGVTPGYSALMIATPAMPPMIWAAMKAGTEEGAIPAKLLENMRPMVMAGLAKLVGGGEEVRRADVGAHRRRGTAGPAGAGEGEDHQDQPGGRDDLRQEMRP